MNKQQKIEWLTCAESPAYFTHMYCQIYDATARTWVPFHLWREQMRTLKKLELYNLTIILKARQLGMSWLVLAFVLWLMLFRPAATGLLFSRRDDEAVHLLDFRLKGMYARLPDWLQATAAPVTSNDHEWVLEGGSTALAFPTSAGDSYTATIAVVDEADLVPDLGKLMRAVKPTIDGGGRMILLSRADKSKPASEFKATYRAAVAGNSPWTPIFLPWHVRPGRDAAWYEAQRLDILGRTAALDDLHEQYPATDTEALAPRTLDKRIAADWLEQCYRLLTPILPASAPALPGLVIYREPVFAHTYVGGADPAEGNPTSDDSALTFIDVQSGEEVAALTGKFQPSVLASHADTIGTYFNRADLMVERNNHGHAVLLWLRDHSSLGRLLGFDGREGWHSTSQGKALLYNATADAFRDRETTIHTFEAYIQLASIEGASLRAPDGEMDDRADSYALATVGRAAARAQTLVVSNYMTDGYEEDEA